MTGRIVPNMEAEMCCQLWKWRNVKRPLDLYLLMWMPVIVVVAMSSVWWSCEP